MTNTFLSRREASAYIVEKYGETFGVSQKTLAKLAVTGGGPAFHKWGRRVGYTAKALDEWAASRISDARRSTSDIGGSHAV